MTREECMRQALAQAEHARSEGEIPVGAVVECGGKVIACAHNERERTQDPTAHAEVLALRRRRLEGCTLYVTLEPCPMCAGAAVLAGVSRVVFGAYDPHAGCAGSVYTIPEDPAFGAGIACEGGLLGGECESLLRAFFEDKRA